jgi:hypothetical protein
MKVPSADEEVAHHTAAAAALDQEDPIEDHVRKTKDLMFLV